MTNYNLLSVQEKEKLVNKFLPKVKIIALHLKARLPQHIGLEELISAGLLGLIEAINKFDPQKQVKLETFVESRIKGAMLDELRKMDWFSREMRRKIKQVEQLLQQEPELSGPELKKYLQEQTGFNEQELDKILLALDNQILISLEAIQPDQIANGDPQEEPIDTVIRKELIDKIAKLIKELSDKEQLVLSLYYEQELTLKEIAEVLELTEGRISQLKTQALQKLRKKLKRKAEL